MSRHCPGISTPSPRQGQRNSRRFNGAELLVDVGLACALSACGAGDAVRPTSAAATIAAPSSSSAEPTGPNGGGTALLPGRAPSGPAPRQIARGPLERAELDALDQGDQAFRMGQLATAREHYERARTIAPQSPRAPIRLLRLRCAELGLQLTYAEAPHHPELEHMLSTLDGLIAEHPEDANAQLERGRILLVLGDAPRAVAGLTRAVHLEPREPEAHSALGVALLASGQVQSALEELEIAARLGPDHPERLTNLGTAYMLRGRVSEAIVSYERALVLAPNDARVHGDLGAAELADGRPDLALPHLLRATELAPDRATFLTNLGYAYQEQGQLDKAVETQRRAIALDPKLGSAWINLGNALAELGQFGAAREALRRAETLDPTDPRAQASLRDLAELEARQPSTR